MTAQNILIQPTTSAVTSGQFTVHLGDALPIIATGLAANEFVTIQIPNASGSFVDYSLAGKLARLDASYNKILIDIPGTYRLVKTVTIAAVGVLVDAR